MARLLGPGTRLRQGGPGRVASYSKSVWTPAQIGSGRGWFAPALGYTYTTDGNGGVPTTLSGNGDVIGWWSNRHVPANPLTQDDASNKPSLVVSGGSSYVFMNRTAERFESLTFASNPFFDNPTTAYLAVRAQKTSGDGEFATWVTLSDDNNDYLNFGGQTYTAFGTTVRKNFANSGLFDAAGGGILEIIATNARWDAYINGVLAHAVTGNTMPTWLSRPTIGAVYGTDGPSFTGRVYGLYLAATDPGATNRALIRDSLWSL